jgi:hypothetical protein
MPWLSSFSPTLFNPPLSTSLLPCCPQLFSSLSEQPNQNRWLIRWLIGHSNWEFCYHQNSFNYEKLCWSQVPVTHFCNPSYLGGWDWEDCNSRSARQIVHKILSPKIEKAKWTGGVAQVIRVPGLQVGGPKFKPWSHRRRKEGRRKDKETLLVRWFDKSLGQPDSCFLLCFVC